jgi:hypothetical protein
VPVERQSRNVAVLERSKMWIPPKHVQTAD